jgi:hypothetical protein
MGHYVINDEPKFGKANIINQHGGVEIQFYDLPPNIVDDDPFVYICVVRTQTHEAALILDDDMYLAEAIADFRPTTFHKVPRNRIIQLQGF